MSAITSDVFMAKLAWPDASVIVLLAPRAATRQVKRDVDERAMNTDRTAGISFAPGMACSETAERKNELEAPRPRIRLTIRQRSLVLEQWPAQ